MKVITDIKGRTQGAIIKLEGIETYMDKNELKNMKRSTGNPRNAVITYKGYVVARPGIKIDREMGNFT